MDFTPSQEQRELSGLTRDILEAEVTPDRLAAVDSETERFDRRLWRTLARAEILAAALPKNVGGQGFGLLEECGVLVELGRQVAPVPYLGSVVACARAIAEFGSDDQVARWGAPAAYGEVLCAPALTDEGVANPAVPGRPNATATPDANGSGWIVSGTKTTVPSGTTADVLLVPASTPSGTAVFLVEPTDPGVALEAQRLTDGDSAARVTLSDVPLAGERVLGGDTADGAAIGRLLHERMTIGRCALQLGVAERALELTVDYAKNRVQFDRPIGSFQAVAGRIADAYIDVEAVRLTLWEAAWRTEEHLDAVTEIATAKFWAADAGHRVAHTAVHIHGGVGIDLDYPLHRYFLAAKRNEFALGGATAQLRRLGAQLAVAE